MRTLAIGDVHGHRTALLAVIEQVQLVAEDFLIFLGDYIDRGPDSKGVVDWIVKQSARWQIIFLGGNHEKMILDARHDETETGFWRSCGGHETLVSYGAEARKDWPSAIPASHWNFFQKTKLWYETATHIFVHGTAEAELEMSDQDERLLLWMACHWMKPHKSGKKVICGHTPQASRLPEHYPFGACIDTGVYDGGWLTCLDVDSGEYWQANEAGETRQGILSFG